MITCYPIQLRVIYVRYNDIYYIYTTLTGSLFAIPEGWGNSKENFKSGQYRIFAWKSLKAKTKTVQKLSLPSRSNTEIRFHTGINQTCDIVQVMVRITN